jgi:uncharacterized protein YjiS (DUF1127 family)
MSLLKTVSEKFSAWRRYRETIRELAQLSDHELHDIGVHRGEIEYIARSSCRFPKAYPVAARQLPLRAAADDSASDALVASSLRAAP